jgi:hypothetical protein
MSDNFIDEFQKLGEAEVLRRVLNGTYAAPLALSAREWLQHKQQQRQEGNDMKRSKREILANIIAAVASIAAIVSIFILFFKK